MRDRFRQLLNLRRSSAFGGTLVDRLMPQIIALLLLENGSMGWNGIQALEPWRQETQGQPGCRRSREVADALAAGMARRAQAVIARLVA